VLASGDRVDAVEEVGAATGVDAAFGELTPEAKVAIIHAEAQRAPVMMVGDGVNAAPALAAATVGVALGARRRSGLIGGSGCRAAGRPARAGDRCRPHRTPDAQD
jgi:P-type E1-E2 ATPase